MLKRIFSVWKHNLSELYTTLLIMLVCWIVGIIILAALLKFDLEATTCVTIGTLLAVFIVIFMNIIFGIISFGCSFNTAISFGSTRKEFLVAEGVTAYLNMAIETAIILIMHSMETALYKMIYTGRECEDMGAFLSNYRLVLGIVLVIPAVRMFCGAFILKYRRVAYWTLWGLWMVGFMGAGNFADYIEENPESTAAKIFTGISDFAIGMPGIAQIAAFVLVLCIIISGPVLLIRKQAVQA